MDERSTVSAVSRAGGLAAAVGVATAMAGVSAIVPGCAQQAESMTPTGGPPIAYAPPAAYDPTERPVTEVLRDWGRRDASASGADGGPERVSSTRWHGVQDGERFAPRVENGAAGPMIPVRLATRGARVEEVLRAIVGDYLDRSLVIDPAVARANQLITLDVDEEMTVAGVRDLLGGLAAIYGWVLEERGGVVFVRPSAGLARSGVAPIMEIRPAASTEQPVVRVRRLRYISPSDAKSALEGLSSEGSVLTPAGRNLIIADTARQANRLSDLLTALDVPAFEGVRFDVYGLRHRDAAQAAELLSALAEQTGLSGRAADPLVSFSAVPGANRLLVIMRDPSLEPAVRSLLAQADVPREDSGRRTFVYRPQHVDGGTLLTAAREWFADRLAPGASPTARQQAGDRPPGLERTGMRLASVDTEPAASMGLGGGGERGGMSAGGVADTVLLIEATLDDYADVVELFGVIDRPPQQAVLTMIVAEVVLNDRLEFGVEYFLEGLDEEGLGIVELAGGISDLASGAPTGSAFFTGADGFAIVQALDSASTVNIIQQPRATVRDGQVVSFQVGGEVPVVAGDIDTDTGGLRRNIEYRDTGILLEIQPLINESGTIDLNIYKEITNVLSSDSELGPEFTTRMLTTSVSVPHGRTLLLGGIIESTTQDSRRKIPLLGDLPLVGPAFQNVEDFEERREIFIAITPEIINTPARVQGTVGGFFSAARGVQRALQESADSLARGVLDADAPPARVGWSVERAIGSAARAARADAARERRGAEEGEAPASHPAPEAEPEPSPIEQLPEPIRGLIEGAGSPRSDAGALFGPGGLAAGPVSRAAEAIKRGAALWSAAVRSAGARAGDAAASERSDEGRGAS